MSSTKEKLLLATTNLGKIREFRGLLGESFECLSPGNFETEPPQVDEDGKTYEENAQKKAAAFYARFGVPTLADDSGLEVEVLDKGPGLYSARFGGLELGWPQRWKHLIDLCRQRTGGPWKARFVCKLCYFSGTESKFFEGICEGLILDRPRGSGGFGYDPLFLYPPLGKTFAELSQPQKDRVSHRALAVRQMLTNFEKGLA